MRRLLDVLDLHAESYAATETLPEFNNRPHFLSRKFGEFLASLLILEEYMDPAEIGRLTPKLANIIACHLNLLRNSAYGKFSSESVCIPLINNLDLILAILRVRFSYPYIFVFV
jgi:hypothetical protein